MVKLAVQISTQLENLAELKPADDCDFHFKVKCTSCNEVTDKWVVVNRQESFDQSGSRGTANFVYKCKLCSREGSMDFDKSVPYRAYTEDDCGQFHTIAVLDCRGLEPVEYEPREGWTAAAANSKIRWNDVDLTEKDWTEYDEKAAEPVSVTELETRIQRA